MTYVPVTVGRRPAGFTVGRGPAVVFTVTGHPGATNYTPPPTIDGVLLTETGDYLALESGDLLLLA